MNKINIDDFNQWVQNKTQKVNLTAPWQNARSNQEPDKLAGIITSGIWILVNNLKLNP